MLKLSKTLKKLNLCFFLIFKPKTLLKKHLKTKQKQKL